MFRIVHVPKASQQGKTNTKQNASNGAVFRGTGYFDPPQSIHSNPWAPPGPGWIGDYMYQRLFDYLPASDEYLPMLGESFEDKPDKTIVHLRQNVVWSDGKPFTSKDVITTYNIGFLAGWPVWRYVTTIDALDDYTVVFNWKKPGALTKPIAFSVYICSPTYIYGKWSDQIAQYIPKRDDMGNVNDTIGQAISEIREDLYNFKPAITDAVGTGPFVCTNVTPSEAVLKKNPKFYAASNIKFDEVRLIRVTTNEVVWSSVMAGQLDAQDHGMPKDVVDQVKVRQPQMKLVLPWDYTQFSLIFNTRLYPMSEVKFRKAIAYAINRQPAQQVSDYFAGPGDTYETGVLPSQMNKWISKDFLATLENYTYNSSKAGDLLNEMGWSKGSDGFWKDNKGKLIQLELSAPAGYHEFVLGGENIADQLNKFGIKTVFKAIDTDAFWKYLDQGQHQIAIDFVMVMWGYGHPWNSYQHMFRDAAYRVGLRDPKASNWQPKMPVKLASGETVDPYRLVDDLFNAVDMSQQKLIVQKLAEVSNQLVLGIPFAEKQVQWMIDTNKLTGYPEDPNDPMFWGPAAIMRMLD